MVLIAKQQNQEVVLVVLTVNQQNQEGVLVVLMGKVKITKSFKTCYFIAKTMVLGLKTKHISLR